MTESPFDLAGLNNLYAQISRPEGLSITELGAMLDALLARPLSAADLQAYREGRGAWKKLTDEVVPVVRFLLRDGVIGRVRFPLDDQPPDAWLWPADQTDPLGIEVTRVLGRARTEQARDLRDGGLGRGFIDLPEAAPQVAFDRARVRQRITHSRQGILERIEVSTVERLAKKSQSRFSGHTLLILAPLGSAPGQDWSGLRDRLSPLAKASPLGRVVIMDDSRSRGPLLEIGRGSP